ncbi:MAG: helix-turn-helix domain-containing protein [Xanthobacteraceae bacterium]|nr:helix-turn-helix domain-containing protein [Xanthobacteraceae bacterium]
MPPRSTPLSNYPVVRSSDPEFVRDRLFSVFGANGFDVGRSNTAFAVDANHLQIRDLGVSYCDYASEVSIRFGEATFVRQFFNIEGVGRYAAGKQAGEIRPGSWSPILHAETPLKLDFKPDYRQLVLRIEVEALRRNLGALIGQDLGQQLVFDETPARQPAMEALRLRLFQFAHDYNARGQFFSDLAAAEVERMVIMKFLMCHRHNYTHYLLREPLPVSSTAVKLVEEYIEANWDKPIDIETMARVSGCSARSLFRQFRKTRGHSPADFVKRVRLDRARHMLQQAGSESSVIQIALKCGFQNAGHFARDYRVTFGELPSATLQRAKRWLS